MSCTMIYSTRYRRIQTFHIQRYVYHKQRPVDIFVQILSTASKNPVQNLSAQIWYNNIFIPTISRTTCTVRTTYV
jgi:hypothetical protein